MIVVVVVHSITKIRDRKVFDYSTLYLIDYITAGYIDGMSYVSSSGKPVRSLS